MLVRRFATCAAALVVAACAGNGEGLDENGRPPSDAAAPLTPDLESIQRNVFTPICTTCHSGAAAPLGLRLDEGASYAMLVNTPSAEVPALNRVTPGDPDASYLIQKLAGTASVGGRMPLNGPPLSAETIATIRQWITDGAQASTVMSATKPDLAPPQLMAVWPTSDAALNEAPREIVVSASKELDTTLLDVNTVHLVRSDDEGSSNAAVDMLISVRSTDPTVIALRPTAAPWMPGHYELRISGGSPVALADRAARPIDGDNDGAAGGDFVLRFHVEPAR